MSQDAEKWAWNVEGVTTAQWAILLVMADCHTVTLGCFPSQEYMAKKAKMSRASLNNHLDVLEAKGFFRRVRSINMHSRKRERTRYILAFEDPSVEYEAPPSTARHAPPPVDKVGGNKGHVQNLDMEYRPNHVQKPCPKNAENHVQSLDSNTKNNNYRNKYARGREAEPPPARSVWTGDPAIRDAVAKDPRYGEAKALSYIDTAKPGEGGRLIARTQTAYLWLVRCEALKGLAVIVPPD